MKRVADLDGAELALWTARAMNQEAEIRSFEMDYGPVFYCNLMDGNRPFMPQKNWEHGGPIIERERIAIDPITRNRNHTAEWQAQVWVPFAVQTGPTPLIAAMRAFVASKFGETVDEVAK